MNNEIREIYLSDLEWTKTHDNMGGVMGNIVFKDNMSYEEYQKLFKTTYFTLCDKDYITNLQKEIRVNNDLIPHFKNRVKELKKEITNLQKENEDYKSRVEKAVEKSQELKDSIDKSNFDGMTKTILILGINQIQNILQNGSDSE